MKIHAITEERFSTSHTSGVLQPPNLKKRTLCAESQQTVNETFEVDLPTLPSHITLH